MSAQVTEAHHRLARELAAYGETTMQDAQAIADSEARAMQEMASRIQAAFHEPLIKEWDTLRAALCAVKLECLTAKDGRAALGHIVRICIDAGITEKLETLIQPKISP